MDGWLVTKIEVEEPGCPKGVDVNIVVNAGNKSLCCLSFGDVFVFAGKENSLSNADRLCHCHEQVFPG
jgi:hypothetical protein